MPSLAGQARRCSAPVTNRSSPSQSAAGGRAGGADTGGAAFLVVFAGGVAGAGFIACSTPQARCATRAGAALGARTRAAATAASRSSSPCAALPKSVRLSASMPTISPRNGTRFR
jgi:hypothetical protein